MWAIGNADINAARDLGLIDIEKYWRCAGQIKEEVNGLHKDWIPALAAFVKHSQRTHDNEEVTENMKVRRDIGPEWASSLFVQLHGSIHCWKMDGKDIADATKLVKELVRCSLQIQNGLLPKVNQLYTLEHLSSYITGETVGKFMKSTKFEKWRASTAENPRNLGAHRIIEISSVLPSAHVVPRDQKRVVFDVSNYIGWDQFNQLYDPDWLNKGIQNADAVARRLGPASTKATNLRLEVAKEEVWKKQEVVERRKAEAVAAKRRRDREGISSSSEDDDNYSDTDDTDPYQENDLNPV